MLLLILVLVTALSFDFTNGFHDTANAVAASIATGAMRPRVAVTLCGAVNFVGAFLSIKVAATIASGIVDQNVVTLPIVFAGLLGAIAWNVLTWYFGLPSSSSHALIGGVVGATAVAAGTHAVKMQSIVAKVVIPAVIAPIVAGLVAAVACFITYRIAKPSKVPRSARVFKLGQIASASLISLAHGTNDAQKTMGIITLALVADHRLDKGANPPTLVIVACAAAIAAGTYFGGWRIINTMGRRLTDVQAPQGFVSDTASAVVLLTSTRAGLPLSTTHITSGAVIGGGIGRPGAVVRWGVARRMVVAWVMTLPCAALVGGLAAVATKHGGDPVIFLVAAVAAAALAGVYALSRRNAVTAKTVTENVPTLGARVPAIDDGAVSTSAAPAPGDNPASTVMVA